jgi:hypothetical protein
MFFSILFFYLLSLQSTCNYYYNFLVIYAHISFLFPAHKWYDFLSINLFRKFYRIFVISISRDTDLFDGNFFSELVFRLRGLQNSFFAFSCLRLFPFSQVLMRIFHNTCLMQSFNSYPEVAIWISKYRTHLFLPDSISDIIHLICQIFILPFIQIRTEQIIWSFSVIFSYHSLFPDFYFPVLISFSILFPYD